MSQTRLQRIASNVVKSGHASRAATPLRALRLDSRYTLGQKHQPLQRRTFVAKATDFLPNHADYTESLSTVREAISKICSNYPEFYWLDIDNTAHWPSEFQQAVACDGWLGIMMPANYGGSELGLADATVMMQTIAESGGGYTASARFI